jgi:hypothetical protein
MDLDILLAQALALVNEDKRGELADIIEKMTTRPVLRIQAGYARDATSYNISDIEVHLSTLDYDPANVRQRYNISISGEAPGDASLARVVRWACYEAAERAGEADPDLHLLSTI